MEGCRRKAGLPKGPEYHDRTRSTEHVWSVCAQLKLKSSCVSHEKYSVERMFELQNCEAFVYQGPSKTTRQRSDLAAISSAGLTRWTDTDEGKPPLRGGPVLLHTATSN